MLQPQVVSSPRVRPKGELDKRAFDPVVTVSPPTPSAFSSNLNASSHPPSPTSNPSSLPSLLPRSEWKRHLQKTNEPLWNYYCSIDPRERCLSFVRTFSPGKKEVLEVLDREVILKLILQHFQRIGALKTVRALQKEAKLKLTPDEQDRFSVDKSFLMHYLRNAVHTIERLWDLTIDDQCDLPPDEDSDDLNSAEVSEDEHSEIDETDEDIEDTSFKQESEESDERSFEREERSISEEEHRGRNRKVQTTSREGSEDEQREDHYKEEGEEDSREREETAEEAEQKANYDKKERLKQIELQERREKRRQRREKRERRRRKKQYRERKEREKKRQEATEEVLEEVLFELGFTVDEKDQDDVNIWNEPSDNRSNIIFEAEHQTSDEHVNVKAASLNKLVERLTSEKLLDPYYLKTFLMTYQSFTTPTIFLNKLTQRFRVPYTGKLPEKDWRIHVQNPIQLKVCNVLKKWVEDHFSDFNEKLLIQLNEFINEIAAGNSALASSVKKSLNKRQKEEGENKKRIFTELPPEPKVPKLIFSPNLTLLHIDEEEIARQLTIQEFNFYSVIKPSELLNLSWSKAKLKHKAKNVLRMIHHFNDVSSWVGTMILNEAKLKNRARMMALMIKTAEHCYHLNNFSTLTAIIAVLNNSALHRLRHTRDEIKNKLEDFAKIEAVMSSELSFQAYRASLARVDPPCIPYLGVHLTDLTFIEDGNPDFIDGLINFHKRKLIYNVISKIQTYQQRAYNLQPVEQIISFFHQTTRADDQELYHLSHLREPRNADKYQLT